MSRLYSFVLPAFKARFLKEAIDSILAQTYTNFELIIVNDASPEDLDAIVNSYDDPRIQYYINEKNIGGKALVEQWNYCISLANSEYIILASDDDIYDKDYLLEMNRLVDKYPEAYVFRPRVQYINNNSEVIDVCGYIPEVSSGIVFLLSLTRGWISSGVPFYVFKRTALNAIGGFADYPMAWFSDNATVLRLSNNGIISSNDILFSFRTSGINISSRPNSEHDTINKLNATVQYYDEFLTYINSSIETSPLNAAIKRSLMREFPNNMQNSLYFMLQRSSLKCVIKLLPTLIKLPFLTTKRLLSFYLRLVYKSIFFK